MWRRDPRVPPLLTPPTPQPEGCPGQGDHGHHGRDRDHPPRGHRDQGGEGPHVLRGSQDPKTGGGPRAPPDPNKVVIPMNGRRDVLCVLLGGKRGWGHGADWGETEARGVGAVRGRIDSCTPSLSPSRHRSPVIHVPRDTPFVPHPCRGGIDLPEPAGRTPKRPCPRRPRGQP